MNKQSLSNSASLRGAVMLLGSLYWEGEQPARDGEKGKRRKSWRDTQLDMASCRELPGIPIRYGRQSDSRNGEFTIMLGGEPSGVAKIANLKSPLPIEDGIVAREAMRILHQQVKAMAEAEGIWTQSNQKHHANWGLVAISINPNSKYCSQLTERWKEFFKPQPAVNPTDFGEGILDPDGILQIGLSNEIWGELSYCLCTPTVPKPKDLRPTPEEIARAVTSGSYFGRTSESGIKTGEDSEIWKHLGRM